MISRVIFAALLLASCSPTATASTNSGDRTFEGLKVRCPVSARVGEPVTIELESENIGASPRMGTLAVSIQGGSPSVAEQKGSYDLFLPGGRAKLARFSHEDNGWKFRPRSEDISPEMTHVEFYDDQWPPKIARTMSVPIVFHAPGTATLLVRATFAKRAGDAVIVDRNYPSDADDLDEQGLPCYRCVIKIDPAQSKAEGPFKIAPEEFTPDAIDFVKGQTFEGITGYKSLDVLITQAEQGDAFAQNNLGVCYQNGTGVAKDEKEAVNWYRKAAEQGIAVAQYSLGVRYQNGTGVVKDEKEAVSWYRKAAKQGYAVAQNNLGVCYQNGTGVVKDEKEAVSWYRKAAEQGIAGAQNNLGMCYLFGIGVAKDFVEAYKWLNLAASQFTKSGEDRDKIALQMTAEQIAEAQYLSSRFTPRTWAEIQADDLAPHDGQSQPPATELSPSSPQWSATAFMITTNGYNVTAAHAVVEATRIVLTRNGMEYPARVIAKDSANDIAILKVSGTFDAVSVQSSSDVKTGVEVCTVGFPNIGLQGAAPKVSRGYLNSLSGLQDDPRTFQISVPIQPGNSGGALIDMRGNVIGVVVGALDQIVSLNITGSLPQNVNYAIKSSYLLPLIEDIPELAGLLKSTPVITTATPEKAISALENATFLLLAY